MWGTERGSKPIIETIQSLCNQKCFARGSQYYKEGRVREFRISGDAVNAKVKGTRNYQVEVNHKRDFESTCIGSAMQSAQLKPSALQGTHVNLLVN